MQEKRKVNPLTWPDYWSIAVRRRWSFLGPFFALGLLGFLATQLWPVSYRSEAVIGGGQKVPEQYVTPNVVSNPDDWLQMMARQVLSWDRLEALINQVGLYRKERARLSKGELIDRMRKDIRIEPVRSPSEQTGSTAFRVSYLGASPAVAQTITGRLASLFIEENQRAREQQSASTTSFLESQLLQAQQDLDQKERQLWQYKERYLGELPEQQQANLQLLTSLQTELASASMSLDRAQQERKYLESMKAQYRTRVAMQTDSNGRLQSPDAILASLRGQLADLESKYTPRYPDVVKLKKEIAQWEAIKQRQARGDHGGSATPDSADPSVIETDSRLKANQLEETSLRNQISNLKGRLQVAQAHLNLVPLRQEELAQVTSDYENAHQYYQSLLQKKMQSELATNLEKQQKGEQFRVLQPATLPKKPVEPNRLEILLGSWFSGIVGGLALATLREATDTRVHDVGEVSLYAGLPVLLSLPTLCSSSEESRAREKHRLEFAAVVLLVLVCFATGIYTYLVG